MLDGEGRSEPREVSLSDEIVFKWSGARNDDRLMMTVERLALLYGDHRRGSRRGVNIHIRGAALLKNCVQTKQPPSRARKARLEEAEASGDLEISTTAGTKTG